jgi:hypothetical protein
MTVFRGRAFSSFASICETSLETASFADCSVGSTSTQSLPFTPVMAASS